MENANDHNGRDTDIDCFNVVRSRFENISLEGTLMQI